MRPEPIATYRLQLHAGFGFEQAAALADYLRKLGVSHVYCSPYLQARKGSLHGYDLVNPAKVSDELGGEAGHENFCKALAAEGLLQILDIVPNHMAIAGRENPWWWDVLENGKLSAYASYFDIDWCAAKDNGRHRVILPVLGDRYGRILEARVFIPGRDGPQFFVHYYDQMFPLTLESLDDILRSAEALCPSAGLDSLADAANVLFHTSTAEAPDVIRYRRDKGKLQKQLAALFLRNSHAARAVDDVLAEVGADPARLDQLLERQHYRLAFWQVSFSELGYRRFFDINQLVALRSEDEAVFQATHRLILRWLARGVLDGVRIDHIDGLYNPAQYLSRLRRKAPRAWIVVEKITGPAEELPADWNVSGTTGYDFVNRVNALFVDPEGEKQLTEFYIAFTGQPADYDAIVHDKKLLVLRETLGGDVHRLTAMLQRVAGRYRQWRDFTREEIETALCECVACFPVYRTYVRPETPCVSKNDERHIGEALDKCRLLRPDIDVDLLDYLESVLLLRVEDEEALDAALRFQQLTGPAMAKGVEDTAFYCFNRLVSQNEVGGNPGRFGMSVEEFQRLCQNGQNRHPHGLLATSTHDTKRSEDVRSRINLLSEIPDAWRSAVLRWSAINDTRRTGGAPDRNTEYHFYQNLIGAWPISAQRMAAYMNKAVREAGTHTSWFHPNAAFEEALEKFVHSVLADRAFIDDLEQFLAPLITPAAINSLSQTLLKLTAPGVPDIYQGSELWNFSLVDPDNRRDVDFNLRRRLLDELDGMLPEAIWAKRDEGLPKLYVIRKILALRRAHPEWFGAAGDYAPVKAAGKKKGHVIAFMRGGKAVSVAMRLPLRLGGEWVDTSITLPSGRWRNALTNEGVSGTMPLARLLQRFPVAFLHPEKGA